MKKTKSSKKIVLKITMSMTPLIYFHNFIVINMSSPSPAYTSFPFSFEEDTMAPDVVESMEQVGGLTSLSLN